jgi:protein-disulfide isomerase
MSKTLLKGLTAAVFLTVTLFSFLPAQTEFVKPDDFCLGGNPSAPVRIEIYSDFQCPSCRDFYLETILPVLKEYGRKNKVYLLYHDFPLKSHKYAFEASRYAVAARRLGRDQWLRVSEALYTDQAKWAADGKPEAAAARVLTPEELSRLKRFLEEPSTDQFINQEMDAARNRQVSSTPTFFLSADGREQKVVGKVSYAVLKDYLDRLLKGAK